MRTSSPWAILNDKLHSRGWVPLCYRSADVQPGYTEGDAVGALSLVALGAPHLTIDFIVGRMFDGNGKIKIGCPRDDLVES
jgi:hypothetical protein